MENIYRKKVLSPKRARPKSYGNPSDPEDVDMEVPIHSGADWRPNWDPVLETMLAQGLKPYAIMKNISKFVSFMEINGSKILVLFVLEIVTLFKASDSLNELWYETLVCFY